MNLLKNAFFGGLLFLPQFFFAQYTDVINSNRPGETMSAFAIGKTVIQAETGIYGIQEKHDLLNYDATGFGMDLTLRYGVFLEKLELIVDLQYQMQNVASPYNNYDKNDFKQTILGAKYLIYDPFKNYEKQTNIYSWKANRRFDWHQLIPAVSVFAGANFVFKGNPYSFTPESSISPKIMLITQNHLGDGKWVFVTNIIADYISTDYPSYGYVLTLTRGFTEKWSGFVENQGYKSDFYSDALVRGGAAYLISKNMQIDASLTTNFKNTPSVLYGGIGFSWRYDGRYKEVQTMTFEKQSKKDQKKSKKEKDSQEIENIRKSKFE